MSPSICQRLIAMSWNQHNTKVFHENSNNTGGKRRGKSKPVGWQQPIQNPDKSVRFYASLAKPRQVGWQQETRTAVKQARTSLAQNWYLIGSALVQSYLRLEHTWYTGHGTLRN